MGEGHNDSEDLDLRDVLDMALDARLDEVHTTAPGRVESYDHAAQTADVRPMVRRTVARADGTLVYEAMPILRAVPVCHPRWGHWYIHAPLAAGDFVRLSFAERDFARWRATGDLSDPIDVRAHHLAHAVATPGLYPRTQPLGDVPTDKLVIGYDGGNTLRLTQAGDILLGTAATKHVALAEDVAAQLTALKAAISAATPTAGDGGAALKAAIMASLSSWPGNVAAAKVKAE